MSDIKNDEDAATLMSPDEFRLGYDNPRDPRIMIINVPVGYCADQPEIGTALIRGKLDEAKQIALQIVAQRRERKAKATGLLKPGMGVA